MDILSKIEEKMVACCQELFASIPEKKQIQLQKTNRDYKGDVTLVVFPLLRLSKKSPEETANLMGEFLATKLDEIAGYNVIKGFLNLEISEEFYFNHLRQVYFGKDYGIHKPQAGVKTYVVEYSSPNTNKPLHLGHVRNNLLGFSVCKILEANGHRVIKTNIVNDRGIHICKSMLAWQKWGNGATPESTGKKGDHLVGEFYVKFDQEYKYQISQLVEKGMGQEEATKQAPLMHEAQAMLRAWEAGDIEVKGLWETMNGWVYDGFDKTYKQLGVAFDKIYYESDTYIIGRETVLRGVAKGVFEQMPDGSAWADLTADGLDRKILLRKDGTSVYITQDIGTAQLRQKDFNPDQMIYVVGNEQDYHFKVLSIVLDKLGFSWARGLYHLSYGMVELPEGKMKSREGTVVDADDLMEGMRATAKEMAQELGKLEGISVAEKERIYEIIGMGALKYFILKVDPVKNMTFDPKESIDFNGNTGPFIQYTHARIRSVLRKAVEGGVTVDLEGINEIKLTDKEKYLLKLIYEFPQVVREAGSQFSPAIIANFTYELAREYNQFYHDYPILKELEADIRGMRLALTTCVGNIIKTAMGLLSIEVPDRM